MGVVKSFRRPRTARDLAWAIELFLRDLLRLPPDEASVNAFGGLFLVDTERGSEAEVIVQARNSAARWVMVDDEQKRLLRAWEDAGAPPLEQVNFHLGDLGGPLSPEAEAAARTVMAGKVCEEIGWTPDEVAAMRKRNFPDILERVELKRHTGRTGTPTNSAELAEAVKACLKAAYGLVATGDDYGLEVDIAPYGVLRMVVGKPEDFESPGTPHAEVAPAGEVQARTPIGRLLAAALEVYHEPGGDGGRRRCIEKILHTIVLMANGYPGTDWPSGTLAIRQGGTTVLIDSEDGVDDGERAHVISDEDTSNLGDDEGGGRDVAAVGERFNPVAQ